VALQKASATPAIATDVTVGWSVRLCLCIVYHTCAPR